MPVMRLRSAISRSISSSENTRVIFALMEPKPALAASYASLMKYEVSHDNRCVGPDHNGTDGRGTLAFNADTLDRQHRRPYASIHVGGHGRGCRRNSPPFGLVWTRRPLDNERGSVGSDQWRARKVPGISERRYPRSHARGPRASQMG